MTNILSAYHSKKDEHKTMDKEKTMSKEHKHEERYGQWAGNPNGNKADLTRCAQEVWQDFIAHQCSRKKGHGPNGIYCKQHAKLWIKGE